MINVENQHFELSVIEGNPKAWLNNNNLTEFIENCDADFDLDDWGGAYGITNDYDALYDCFIKMSQDYKDVVFKIWLDATWDSMETQIFFKNGKSYSQERMFPEYDERLLR